MRQLKEEKLNYSKSVVKEFYQEIINWKNIIDI